LAGGIEIIVIIVQFQLMLAVHRRRRKTHRYGAQLLFPSLSTIFAGTFHSFVNGGCALCRYHAHPSHQSPGDIDP
jgi:hypothetical protein